MHETLLGLTTLAGLIGLIFAFGVAISWIDAYFSGWLDLGRRFPVRDFEYRMQRIAVRGAINGYPYSLKVEANADYLTLRQRDDWFAKPLFFHPPLTIPRKAVGQVTFERGLLSRSVTFFVDEEMITLYGDVVDAEFWH